MITPKKVSIAKKAVSLEYLKLCFRLNSGFFKQICREIIFLR